MLDVYEKVKEIKLSFRQMMDGAVAQSMRDKGVDYHLNWGATIPRLQQMAEDIKAEYVEKPSENASDASEHSPLYHLAIALWKENVRECKILAVMLMPPAEMLPEVVDIWMEQVATQELAEQAAFQLFQYLPFAPDKAFRWIAGSQEYEQLCGFHVLSRLFMNGQEPNERGINEYIDQLLAALQGPYPSVRKAAFQSAQHFAELGLVYERLTKSALKSVNLDFF